MIAGLLALGLVLSPGWILAEDGASTSAQKTAHRPRPKVGKLPIVRETVRVTVLAHRRYADPVAQRNAANGQGIKKSRHPILLSDVSDVLPHLPGNRLGDVRGR